MSQPRKSAIMRSIQDGQFYARSHFQPYEFATPVITVHVSASSRVPVSSSPSCNAPPQLCNFFSFIASLHLTIYLSPSSAKAFALLLCSSLTMGAESAAHSCAGLKSSHHPIDLLATSRCTMTLAYTRMSTSGYLRGTAGRIRTLNCFIV
jgi:hypothetical protein